MIRISMLCGIIKIRENRIVKLINSCLYSYGYMLLIAALMAISNIFALEFAVFYVYLLFVILTVLFSEDCFPIMPMFCCGYMLFSAKNNPATNYGEHFLSSKANITQFIVIAVAVFVLLLIRLIYELIAKRRYKQFSYPLTIGFVLLGMAYICGGAISSEYSLRTVVFGALQIISLCFTYYYFMFSVNWEKRRGSDIAFMLSAVGIGLVLQIIGMYVYPGVLEAIKDGTFERDMLISGWGMYNNVGSMMAMMIPAPFYLATIRKIGFPWILLSCVFMVAVIFTQSRGSMLSGTVVFFLCVIVMLCCSCGKTRLWNGIAMLGILIGVMSLAAFAWEEIYEKVFSFFEENEFFVSQGRLDTYKYGLDKFHENPIFGNGFYIGEDLLYQHGVNTLPDKAFLPPRYHNTYIQLLASCGIVGLIAYMVHRIQTLILIFKKRNVFNMFMGLSIAVLLISSLVDCHFFNFGPGLTYGIIIICMEKISNRNIKKRIVFVD